jgi:hypothetical protein
MNDSIRKLIKIEQRARYIMELREANERRWDRAYKEARNTPEWKAFCEQTGSSDLYNYGDVIC